MKATKEQKEEFKKILNEFKLCYGLRDSYDETKKAIEKLEIMINFIEVEE